MIFWSEEISQQLLKLGASIYVEYQLPKPLIITREITIIQKAKELYSDKSILLKINKIRMYHKIIFVLQLEEDIQFYNHHIQFPEVKKNNGLVYFWNKFKREVQVNMKDEKYYGNIKSIKWQRCDRKISNGNMTYELIENGIYKRVGFQKMSNKYAV